MGEASFVPVDGSVGFLLGEPLLVVYDKFAFVTVESAEEDGRGVCEGCQVGYGFGKTRAMG